ncbi:MAG: hypothetical protein ACRBBO_14375 [Cognatishimia sp.]
MNYETQELEEILEYLVSAIENRTDGATYVPIFERVERELQKNRDSISTLDRIKAMAAKQRAPQKVVRLAA